jgi:hypothetical protein
MPELLRRRRCEGEHQVTPATMMRIAMRVQQAWHMAQAWLLLMQANRRTKRRHRLPSPGYDELRSPAFIVVMLAAVVVLAIDMGDAWPAVIALLRVAVVGA